MEIKIKDLSILLYKYGDRVPQSRTTALNMNVISMGGSSFYRSPMQSEKGRLPLSYWVESLF